MRELFGDRVAALDMTRAEYVERNDDGPRGYIEFCKATFGPIIAIYGGLDGEAGRVAALDSDALAFAERANSGPPDGPAEFSYEYLLVVARKR